MSELLLPGNIISMDRRATDRLIAAAAGMGRCSTCGYWATEGIWCPPPPGKP